MEKAPSRVMRVLEKLRSKGLGSLLSAFVKKYLWRSWTLIWMDRDLSLPMSVPSRLRNMEIVQMQVSDLDRLHPFFADRRENLADLLAAGVRGYGAFRPGSGIIGFLWVSAGSFDDRDYYHCSFPVNEGEVYQFSGEIAEEFRGGSGAIEVLRAAWVDSAARGYQKTVLTVDEENINSLRLQLNVGFVERFQITRVIRLFGRYYYSWQRKYDNPRLEHLKKKRKAKEV